MHPKVRAEYSRLKNVETSERDKPENQGRTVKYDPKAKSVTVDGKVIDSFKIRFF